MPRRAPPLESFAPELKQLWAAAALEPITVKLSSRQRAVTLRHRLYKLRTALNEASDPLYQSAKYASIRVQPRVPAEPDGPWDLIVEPADSEFREAIQAAGVGDAASEPPPLDLDLETED